MNSSFRRSPVDNGVSLQSGSPTSTFVRFLVSGDRRFSDLVTKVAGLIPDILVEEVENANVLSGPLEGPVVFLRQNPQYPAPMKSGVPAVILATLSAQYEKPRYENGWYHLPLQSGEKSLLKASFCFLSALARQTVGITDDPFFSFDPQGRLVQAGSVVETICSHVNMGFWGYDPARMTLEFSRNLLERFPDASRSLHAGLYIHPDDRTDLFLWFFTVISGSSSLSISFRFLAGNGQVIRCRMSNLAEMIRGFLSAGLFTCSVSGECRSPVEVCLMDNFFLSDLGPGNRIPSVSRAELEEQVRTLSSEVQRKSRDIEEIRQEKDRLITGIGHDLKTPLTPLIGILPVVRRKITDEKLAAYLDVAIKNACEMQELLTSILKMDHLNDRYFPLSGVPFSVREMFDELIINFQFEILKKKISIQNSVSPDLRIRINPVEFDTIFEELLHNAIQFSHPGGTVSLEAEEKGDSLEIRVCDTGLGISEEDQARIFDKFYKVDPSRHDGSSHGLGLSIIRQIVEQNRGMIRVTSDGEGKGTCFTLIFPGRNDLSRFRNGV